MSDIIIDRLQTIDSSQADMLKKIYQAVQWWDKSWDTDWLIKIVTHSTLFIVAKKNEKIIGMGRLISDSLSDGYIQDVAVLPDYQNCGIGAKIVQQLISDAQQQGIDWIGLIGSPQTEHFYEKLGFEVMQKHIPFHYKGNL